MKRCVGTIWLMLLLSGCQSSEEKAARAKILTPELLTDVFIIEQPSKNLLCGRYFDERFIYTGDGLVVSDTKNVEYVDLFWVVCSNGNPKAAETVERKIADLKETIKTEDPIDSLNWLESVKKSDIDDSEMITLGVWSNEEIEGNLNIDKVTPLLTVRCMENKTSAAIAWKRYLGIDSTMMITRIDKEVAVDQEWDISTANNTVISQKAIPFIKSLFGKDKLLARITPYGADPVTVTFDISGLDEQIKPLRTACNW